MQDYKKRVIIEYKELCEKIDKLSLFVIKNPLNLNEKTITNLYMQLHAMELYKYCLEQRAIEENIEL